MREKGSRSSRTCCRIVLALTTALLIVSPSLAGTPQGFAQVDSVDVSAKSVVLGGDTYQLTPATRFVDTEGRKATLAQLRPIPEGVVLFSGEDVDAVAWQAVQSTSGWVLTDLQILRAMPD